QIHNSWRRGESQSIGSGQAHKTIRTLQKLIPNAHAHLRRVRGKIGQFRNLRGSRIVAAHGNGKGIVEAQRRHDNEIEAAEVFFAHNLKNHFRIRDDRLLEDCGQSRASVFDIEVNSPGKNGLLADIRPGQIEAALHGNFYATLQNLSQELSKHQLFREVLAAD